MASLAELARARTDLDESTVDHLHRLVAAWGLLADLAFADLLLYSPCDRAGSSEAGSGRSRQSEFMVLAHARASNGPTVHDVDPVGEVISGGSVAPLLATMAGSPIIRPLQDEVVVEYVPVCCGGEVVAVLTRQTDPELIRRPNPLANIYRGLYDRFSRMVADGRFPYDRVEQLGEFREPRVGDGVLAVDREGRIEYASPNANSALHRLGVMGVATGRRLSDLGLDETVIRRSFWRRRSTVSELEHGPDLTVVMRSYPLLAEDRITGAVALLRDVSEIRHRDRLLVSKDTTIREIHHRVKNNLQTVAALLRLQARRLDNPDARTAIEQSVRRISAIALVHEHLALDTTAEVDFDSLVVPLAKKVEEGLGAPERPLRIVVQGGIGEIAGDVAMPLALVLAELVQNSFDHGTAGPRSHGSGSSNTGDNDSGSDASGSDASGDNDSGSDDFSGGSDAVVVTVKLSRDDEGLSMSVIDRGPGVPEGFSLDRDAGLGLTIVRTLVVHDLRGRISIRGASFNSPRGTVIDVTVPHTCLAAEGPAEV